MKRLTILLLLIPFLLLACGGDTAEAPADYDIDEATGLPLNPDPLPEGDFIVEGVVASMNLTPQTTPEFVVRAPSGKTYRIRSQALSEVTYDDGEAIPASGFSQNMDVRATVQQTAADAGSGGIGILVSEDLTILK